MCWVNGKRHSNLRNDLFVCVPQYALLWFILTSKEKQTLHNFLADVKRHLLTLDTYKDGEGERFYSILAQWANEFLVLTYRGIDEKLLTWTSMTQKQMHNRKVHPESLDWGEHHPLDSLPTLLANQWWTVPSLAIGNCLQNLGERL